MYCRQATEMTGSPADLLSRRCVTILKKALSADVWPNSDLKLAWFDKILITVEGQQPNFNNICTALELLAFLLTILVSIRVGVRFSWVLLSRGVQKTEIWFGFRYKKSEHNPNRPKI